MTNSWKNLFPYRLPFCLFGILLAGLGISFMAYGQLGYDSFSTLSYGVAKQLGLSLGQGISLMQLSLALLVFFIDRKHIHLATVLMAVFVGVFTDFFLYVWKSFLPAAQGNLPLSFLYVVVGIAFLSLAVTIYLETNLGSSSVDAVPEIIVQKTKWPYAYVRIALEAVFFAGGLWMGAPFGITPLLCIVFFGPFIAGMRKLLLPYLVFLKK